MQWQKNEFLTEAEAIIEEECKREMGRTVAGLTENNQIRLSVAVGAR